MVVGSLSYKKEEGLEKRTACNCGLKRGGLYAIGTAVGSISILMTITWLVVCKGRKCELVKRKWRQEKFVDQRKEDRLAH